MNAAAKPLGAAPGCAQGRSPEGRLEVFLRAPGQAGSWARTRDGD
jgi:hypothetical protein